MCAVKSRTRLRPGFKYMDGDEDYEDVEERRRETRRNIMKTQLYNINDAVKIGIRCHNLHASVCLT